MIDTISVDNGRPTAYDIHITEDFSLLCEKLKSIKNDESTRLCIVSDSNVGSYYSKEVRIALCEYYSNVFEFEFVAGEANKNLSSIEDLYAFLVYKGFSRGDMLIALGGGVVGDMCGFAAATYMRGIDFIQIPTTLLAQVDSSVGGKTGVDFLGYKNMIGAFNMPRMVYINTSVLKTLPEEQFNAGMAEVIKYGLIMDRDFFEWLKNDSDSITADNAKAMLKVIRTSCQCKRRIVEEDPTEKGIRAILNFGHTIGHAIEKVSDFSLLHGEGVGLGMIAAMKLSCDIYGLDGDNLSELILLLKAFDLPVNVDSISAKDVVKATRSDKKMSSKGIRFILLEAIGKAVINTDVSEEQISAAVNEVVR